MAKYKPYRFFIYAGARICGEMVKRLPRSWAMGLARWGGRVAYSLVARQRSKTLSNLRIAFAPEKSEREINRIAKAVFEHLAQSAADFFQSPKYAKADFEKLIDLGDAAERYAQLLKEGKGIISITAHLGSWEFLAGIFGVIGFKGAVLARRIRYEKFNDWITGIRMQMHVPTLYRDDSSREVMKLLARNEIVGLLPDQDIESLKGVFVEFFNRPAYTPVAPVRLALASGAPMVVNFMVRTPEGRYRYVLADVIRPRIETTREEAVQRYTQLWMKRFEEVIRKYPEQWAWMHDRWKTTPEKKGVADMVKAEEKI